MRYSIALAALSACSAVAVPWGQYTYTTDSEITVALSNSAKALGARVEIIEGQWLEQAPSAQGPFTTVNILLGRNVQNKDIRCKLLDDKGNAIKAERGVNNVDSTFADAGKGEWKLLQESLVSKVICDPSFKKGGGGSGEEIGVLLSNQATEEGVRFSLVSGGRDEEEVRTTSVFSSVEVTAPASQPDLRCKLLDKAGNEVTVKRGENVDVTFADGGKGPWNFEIPKSSQVGKIICDPTFKKRGA